MKFSKKVLIPVFATAMGLSVIGGVSGAVAWYQYNSKVTANFIGVSVVDKGVLQLSEDGSTFTRAVDKTADPKLKVKPVTFGDTSTGFTGSTQGWMYPESGAGIGYYEKEGNNPGWEKAVKGTDYLQFELYFNAYENDSTATETNGKKYLEKSVHISDNFIRCLNSTTGLEDSTHVADQAMRIQLDVEGGNSYIIGKAAGTTNLYGTLDLDGSGSADIYYNNPFITLPTGAVAGQPVIYGNQDETQAVTAVTSYGTSGTELFKTTGTATPVHVKVTIWMEGWAMINSSAVWDPSKTAGCDVQVALEFSTVD